MGNKRSNIDEEIKPDKQEGDSSEGGDNRRQTEEPEVAQEGLGKRKMGTTAKKPKNVLYSPPKKIPTPKQMRQVNRKGTKKSKSFTKRSTSDEAITRERKQSGKRTDESVGNKRSNKDEEIKTDQQEEYSSEGGDGRRQNDELSSEGGDDKTTSQYPKIET